MAESRTSNVLKNSGARFLQRIASVLIQFILRTVFIYLLGKEYTGVSGLFTDILNVLSLMEAGLDTSLIYALYKPLAEKDESRVKALLDFYKKAFIIIGGIVLVLGVALIPFLDYIVKDVPSIKEDIRLIFVFYLVTSASSYFFVYRTILLTADQKSRVVSKWRTIVMAAECVLEVAFLYFTRQFLAYLVIHLVATLVTNVIISLKATRFYPQYFGASEQQERLSKSETGKIIRDILCLTAYNFSGVVINSTDSIFISAFIGTVQVAIIGNFTLIINSIRTIVSQVIDVVKPSIGNLAATTDTQRQEMVFNRIHFLCFYIATFCCACLYTLLNPFIGEIWFDASYKTAPILVAVLTLNFYIAIMVFPVEAFRTANGLFVQGWVRPIIMALLNIALDFIMGLRWGALGIFLATSISRLLTQVWYDPYLVYKRVFNKKVWHYLANYFVMMAVAASICFVTEKAAGLVSLSNRWLSFMLKTVIAAAMPNILLGILCLKNKNYQYFVNLVRSKLLHR